MTQPRRLILTKLCFVMTITLVACSTDNSSPDAKAVSPDASVADTRHSEDVRAESDTSNPSGDATSSDNDGGSGAGGVSGVHPRWVLYDGHGEAVEAIVGGPGLSLDRHPAYQPVGTVIDPESANHDCVLVAAIGDESMPMPVSYHLPTGTIGPCAYDYTSLVVYLDAQCSGDPYLNPSNFFVVKVGQDSVWPQGEIVQPDTVYSTASGTCQEQSNSTKLVSFQPVPSWIRDALPTPPYTVRPEY